MIPTKPPVKPEAGDNSRPLPWEQVEVAVPLPVFGTYSYSVPPALRAQVAAGKRVLVQFGARRVTAYILGPADPAPDERRKLKEIRELQDGAPLFPSGMIPFFRWIADYYMHPLGEVVRTAVPGGLTAVEQAVYHLTDSGL